MTDGPHSLTANAAVEAVASGRLSSVDLVKSCLAQIAKTDPLIKAWAHLDAESALAQADECDRIRRGGFAIGKLHGIPVGLKDIVDTVDMPTERGTTVFAGRQPDCDARIVEKLREAGAVIMGKTVTTEFAFVHPNETRNPHNPDHSPGGSSSGSAAAVAAGHVPLAIGTQTNGSVIRPASFCGTFGFKPTRGAVSREGLLQTSVSLDQVGCFGRSLADVALLTDVISGYDQRDPESLPRPNPDSLKGALSEAPVTPSFAWLDLPFYGRLHEDARSGLNLVLDALGSSLTRMTAAETLSDLVAVQETIHKFEICEHQGSVFEAGWEELSETLKSIITSGRQITRAQYEDALAVKLSAQAFFADFFTQFDAIIAPSADGEAPKFEDGTGDPIFCTLWTLAGLPCVTLPLLVGDTGLPIGVQLIGPLERDDRLLRTAHWLQTHLTAHAQEKGI